MNDPVEDSFVVFLHSSEYDRLYQAASLLLTASSMGWRCYLFLFFQALASFIEGTWDEVDLSPSARSCGEGAGGPRQLKGASEWMERLQKGFELSNFPSLYDMLSSARKESGGLTICACSTSVKLLGLEPSVVKKKVDEIVGLPTMFQIASTAKHSLYI